MAHIMYGALCDELRSRAGLWHKLGSSGQDWLLCVRSSGFNFESIDTVSSKFEITKEEEEEDDDEE